MAITRQLLLIKMQSLCGKDRILFLARSEQYKCYHYFPDRLPNYNTIIADFDPSENRYFPKKWLTFPRNVYTSKQR